MIVNLSDVPDVERAIELRPDAKYVLFTPTLSPKGAESLMRHLQERGIRVIVLFGLQGARLMEIVSETD